MILIALAVTGAVVGAVGFVVALAARNRADQAVEECMEMVRRQLHAASGAADHRAIRDIAIVHYDALKEVAGGLSFSLALLNATGNGVVLTSINGRTETRTYAKVVEHGRGRQLLSPEEDEAVRSAQLGKGPSIRLDDPLEVRVNGHPGVPSARNGLSDPVT